MNIGQTEGNEKNTTKALFISMVGKPNVGKSSILNMVMDYKVSIVSPKPQTTRDIINAVLTLGDVQIIFVDTPGIYKTNTLLGRCISDKVNSSFTTSDACLHVVEAGKPTSNVDKNITYTLKAHNIPSILAINKVDKLKNKELLFEQIKNFTREYEYAAVVPISAKIQSGKQDLIDEIKKLAIPSPFFFPEDTITDQTERKIIGEIIREKALILLSSEVPHGIAVSVDDMKTKKGGVTHISSTLYCDNERHKKIIIGKYGEMIKRIGTYARQDIEKMLGCQTNIQIWVKVKEDWQNREAMLKSLEYMD